MNIKLIAYAIAAALVLVLWGGIALWQMRDAAYEQGRADERNTNTLNAYQAAEKTARRVEKIDVEIDRLSEDDVDRVLRALGIMRSDADR